MPIPADVFYLLHLAGSTKVRGQARMMRLLVFAVAALIAFDGNAAEQTFPADGGLVYFNMPAGNIGCQYTPAGGSDVYVPEDGGPELGCDRIEPTYQRFILGKAGKARRFQNAGDTACCDGSHILSYGNSWKKGPFSCLSSKTGLSCTRSDGHGFYISRSKTDVY